MKALTALATAGADYAGAVQHLADTLPEPPRRGQIVEWQGGKYRLNRRAVADITHAYNDADCGHIYHCHIFEEGGKAVAFVEPRPYARDDGEGFIPCPEGHAPQLKDLLTNGTEPVWCELCRETPEFYPVGQNLYPELPNFYHFAPDLEARTREISDSKITYSEITFR